MDYSKLLRIFLLIAFVMLILAVLTQARDTDGDGEDDSVDPAEMNYDDLDDDNDGIPDAEDPDDDNDGIMDEEDDDWLGNDEL